MTKAQLQKDVNFLLRRSMKAGNCSFREDRDTGVSSNSIVAIAYGLILLDAQELPADRDDLAACKRMWKILPIHRKNAIAMKAFDKAHKAILEKQ